MSPQETIVTEWSPVERALFRFAFIFFLILILPINADFFKQLFSINLLNLHFGQLFELVRYTPDFTGNPTDWVNAVVVILIALIGTLVWTIRDKEVKEYSQLYYWLRVVVRYRLAAALLVFAFIKLYPLQSPEPSISNLNTAYGDFSAWKLFSLTLGVVPGYQSFLGGIELLAAVLLLFRRTTTLATLIIIPFTGNVFFSNLAYEGGEAYYSFYLVLLTGFLLLYDLKRLYSLIAEEKPTFPNQLQPAYPARWMKPTQWLLKGIFYFIFIFWYGLEAKAAYQNDPYQYPDSAGLTNSAGIYNVKTFKRNNETLPYSAEDPARWKDVVFEKWATISIRSNRPVVIDSSNIEHIYQLSSQRNYEYLGSGGRHYYSYDVNETEGKIQLTNRNKNYQGEELELSFSRPDSTTIILQGLDENRDSLYVILEKTDKKYLLEEVKKTGRRGALKL